jgi:hypothetical protein
MRHEKGTDLPGMTPALGARIGVIYASPDCDRKTVLKAILAEEKLKREQIVLVLPQKNKAYQRPEEFDDLKMLCEKLQAELIFVTPSGPGPADFARRRRFAVYSTIESFVHASITGTIKKSVIRHEKGTDLPGITPALGARIGVIHISPDCDRRTALTAILAEEKLKREQIVLVLPQKNRVYQSAEDFNDLKMLRGKLQAELIFVTPSGPGPADFARQRRFAVYPNIESFVRASTASNAGQSNPTASSQPNQAERKGWFGTKKVIPMPRVGERDEEREIILDDPETQLAPTRNLETHTTDLPDRKKSININTADPETEPITIASTHDMLLTDQSIDLDNWMEWIGECLQCGGLVSHNANYCPGCQLDLTVSESGLHLKTHTEFDVADIKAYINDKYLMEGY